MSSIWHNEFHETLRNCCFVILVDGFWSIWSPWGPCSKSCGKGEKRRSRGCNRPLNRGKSCVGEMFERVPCNKQSCTGKPLPEQLYWHNSLDEQSPIYENHRLTGHNQFQSFLLSDCSKRKHEECQNISPHLTNETFSFRANVFDKISRVSQKKLCP